MSNKRVTIYDLAKVLGVSPSYVSKALNNHPSISEKIKQSIGQKATELNYKQNSRAVNLRQGSSKIIGVIVPHIDQSFFSEAIAGIEEVCFAHNHGLIICQSHESFKQECLAIDTLIHQNVDCILISISAETRNADYLQMITKSNIELIQFDRYIEDIDSYKVFNDNEEVSYNVVNNLISQGYKRIAFIGGPEHLIIYEKRKAGYLKAINEAGLDIPPQFIANDVLSREKATSVAMKLLTSENPPDAFFTVSDHQSLGILQVAESLNIRIPEDVGIFGFANEVFTELIRPSLSSIDQKSKDLGRIAAGVYFDKILRNRNADKKNYQDKPANKQELIKKEIIKSEIIIRQSSRKS